MARGDYSWADFWSNGRFPSGTAFNDIAAAMMPQPQAPYYGPRTQVQRPPFQQWLTEAFNPLLSRYGPINLNERWGGFGYKGGAKYDPLTGHWGEPVFPYEWPWQMVGSNMYKYKW